MSVLYILCREIYNTNFAYTHKQYEKSVLFDHSLMSSQIAIWLCDEWMESFRYARMSAEL